MVGSCVVGGAVILWGKGQKWTEMEETFNIRNDEITW